MKLLLECLLSANIFLHWVYERLLECSLSANIFLHWLHEAFVEKFVEC